MTAVTEPTPIAPEVPAQRSSEIRGLRGRYAAVSSRVPVASIGVLVLVWVWGATQVVGFATGPSVRAMLVIAALLGLCALGQTLVVLVAQLDLAVPGYITIGAVCAVKLGGGQHWPLPLAALAAAALCAVAGAACGWICHHFQVQSLVVTLGMYSVITSVVLVTTRSSIVDPPPAVLTRLTGVTGTTLGLPVPPVVAVWAMVTVVVSLVLARTPAGRRLYAVGANPRAAAGLLINTGRVRVGVFAVSAALSGLAGMLVAGFASGATTTIGDPYLFTGLAAVIVGGNALGTGRGDYLRTVLGALVLTMLTTILAGQGLGIGDTRIVYGVVIVIVVTIYGRQTRLRDRL